MRSIRYALFVILTSLLPVCSYTAQTAQPSNNQSSHTSKKADSKPPPSAQEIADAKAKGLVWVNTSTHIYHKDGSFYGTTKHGKFMTEADAQKAGYRAAKTGGSKKTKGAASSQ
jgi:hypothetical protein